MKALSIAHDYAIRYAAKSLLRRAGGAFMKEPRHSGVNLNSKRRATLSDVARRAGVSPVTVSR
ncbi:MAG: LacI family DNA-binding transcriptional regulator, partial [Devosia sp.]|nr:LacI family DNA-binding transcriptional regulator [Devosia sp.]